MREGERKRRREGEREREEEGEGEKFIIIKKNVYV